MSENNILLQHEQDGVLVLTFNHKKPQNPFCDELQDAVMDALKTAENNTKINAVVLFGGENRSFCVGGDFKEAIELGDPIIIAKTLNKVVDLYLAILHFSKPIIAALDNYVIGMGFQVAMLTDYRVATQNTSFIMPELKNGVGCTLGGAMTEFLFGRFIMQEICYECEKISLEKCIQLKLINELVEPTQLLAKAITKAKQYGSFPPKAFRGTKKANNKRFIEAIEKSRQNTVAVHTDVFINKEHRKHMENILKQN